MSMDLLRNRILPIVGGIALVAGVALFVATTRSSSDDGQPERDWQAEINAKNARIVELDTHTAELDAHIAEQDKHLAEQKQYIAEQAATLAECNKKLAEQEKELNELRGQRAAAKAKGPGDGLKQR